jgi:hypothetical protein
MAHWNDKPRRVTLTALSASMLLSACAVNPLVAWDAPKLASDKSMSLDFAKDYARSSRDAYQQRLNDQVGQQSGLASALLGLGALATGFGLAKAHRDSYTSIALLGGTGYALGQQNLRPERLKVYLAGIEALNCALAVVTPLDMSEAEFKELVKLTDMLNERLAEQAEAAADFRAKVESLPADQRSAALVALADASDILQKAGQLTQSGTRNLRGKVRAAGHQLVNTVDRVRTEVDKAALETVPDLSSVAKLIASLADFAGNILPGAKLDDRIRSATQALGSAQSSGGLDKDARRTPVLAVSYGALSRANRNLSVAIASVQDRLAGLDPEASSTALAQCKVAGVVAGLSLTEDELKFGGGKEETLSFVASGGTKPYQGALMTGGSTGVTVRAPVAFDSRFDVSVAASVKEGSFKLLVQDSSSPTAKTRMVLVVVGKTKTAAADTAPAKEAEPKTVAEFADKMAIQLKFTSPAGHELTLTKKDLDSKPDSLILTVACTAKAGKAADTVADTVVALMTKAGVKDAWLNVIAADSTIKQKIEFATGTDAKCIAKS